MALPRRQLPRRQLALRQLLGPAAARRAQQGAHQSALPHVQLVVCGGGHKEGRYLRWARDAVAGVVQCGWQETGSRCGWFMFLDGKMMSIASGRLVRGCKPRCTDCKRRRSGAQPAPPLAH